MTEYFDAAETRSEAEREADLIGKLQRQIAHAKERAPAWATRLADVDAASITSRAALATIPVLRKAELMAAQAETPPFGGFVAAAPGEFGRVFMSPGPVWEPQGAGVDPFNGRRALFAAGFRRGDIVLNAFSYHLTPGGFILDEAAIALGCTVFPAGVGNTEAQVEAVGKLRPSGYIGTPDFLKVLLDKAAEGGHDASSIKRALVSGGALFPALRQEYETRGVAVLQAYATADLGVIAYESEAREGLIVNEDTIVEIVRPGTDDPVAPGEVGEVVVTTFNATYPLIRFGTGDLSAVLPGASPCGRSNMRIKGWMGRADQRTKVKGMFVDPAQVARVVREAGGIGKARLVVDRAGDQDSLRLLVEPAAGSAPDAGAIAERLREITKLRGTVEIVAAGSLPNDGKVIADERKYD
ncbi:MAG: AMP-binding protein [Hyphomicrobiales bacterium]